MRSSSYFRKFTLISVWTDPETGAGSVHSESKTFHNSFSFRWNWPDQSNAKDPDWARVGFWIWVWIWRVNWVWRHWSLELGLARLPENPESAEIVELVSDILDLMSTVLLAGVSGLEAMLLVDREEMEVLLAYLKKWHTSTHCWSGTSCGCVPAPEDQM